MTKAVVDSRFAKPSTLFFGIGAQKAGTSWLHAYLKQHPDACVPPVKELHYWSYLQKGGSFTHDVQKEQLAKAQKEGVTPGRFLDLCIKMRETKDPTHTRYADILFRRFEGQKILGEITPDYAKLSTESFAQMAALNADTRFIFLMRDPIERLHSAMRKRLRNRDGGDRARKFGKDEVLAELKTVLTGKRQSAVLRSQYSRTINNLEAAVAPEKIGYFFYEDVFEKGNADDICDFLGIAHIPGDFETRINPGNPQEKEFDLAFRALALERLGEEYSKMRAKFGDRLPEAWKRHLAESSDLASSAGV